MTFIFSYLGKNKQIENARSAVVVLTKIFQHSKNRTGFYDGLKKPSGISIFFQNSFITLKKRYFDVIYDGSTEASFNAFFHDLFNYQNRVLGNISCGFLRFVFVPELESN